MPKQKAEVLVPDGMNPLPEKHEIDIAKLISKHYNCIVEFLKPIASYKTKTPDIVMNGMMWEIKSPTGNSKKSTIECQFKGLKQSRNLIIDGRRTKLTDTFVQNQIKTEILKHSRVGNIIYITKPGKIIEVR